MRKGLGEGTHVSYTLEEESYLETTKNMTFSLKSQTSPHHSNPCLGSAKPQR